MMFAQSLTFSKKYTRKTRQIRSKMRGAIEKLHHNKKKTILKIQPLLPIFLQASINSSMQLFKLNNTTFPNFHAEK